MPGVHDLPLGATAGRGPASVELAQVHAQLASLKAERDFAEREHERAVAEKDERLNDLAADLGLGRIRDEEYEARKAATVAQAEAAAAALERATLKVRGFEQRGLELVERWEDEQRELRADALRAAEANLAEAEQAAAERRAEHEAALRALEAVDAAGWLERRAAFSASAAAALREREQEDARLVHWAVSQGGGQFVMSQVPDHLHERVLAQLRARGGRAA